jgi:hypothetical protein
MQTILLSSFFCLISFGVETRLDTNPQDSQIKRECCEVDVRVVDPISGEVIDYQVEACAGWFLSDSDKAYERACAKASEAASTIGVD